ncbi:MAG: hypothetical protein IPK93_06915 [Solirubrobacterales bacterium]|nr:hypothetical protein [Solirubrobacterales bacterium]
MTDIAFDDSIQGQTILTFDGLVVELFTERFGSVARLIVGLLRVEVGNVDRRGNQSVTMVPGNKGGGFTLTVPAAAWPQVQPVVEEIRSAAG